MDSGDRFQSLIGILQTISDVTGMTQANGFQSLIGILQTK